MRKKTKATVATKTTKQPLQFDPAKKQILHIHNSPQPSGGLPRQFIDNKHWQEIRMGSYSASNPDITASLLTMKGVASQKFHAVWLPSGNLEQFYFHEVPIALKEVHRVLQDGGVAVITVFDIQKIAEYVAKGNLEGPLYQVREGLMLSAMDILYGYRPQLQAGNMTVNPNTAFTAHTLATKLNEAGFNKIYIKREGIALSAVAHKLAQDKSIPAQIEIAEENINNMMRTRDELDKAPEIWTAPSPLFPVKK